MRQVSSLSSGNWSARRLPYGLVVMSAKDLLEACKSSYTFNAVANDVFDVVSAESYDFRTQLLSQT